LKPPVYLDNNATTALDERVLEAMLPFLRGMYGNAASTTHVYGWQAAEAVKMAREQVALLIGADSPEEIVFTSGATEADNLGLKGVAEAYASKGDHIITVATEHKAVLDTCKWLEKTGRRVTYLGVDRDGLIDLGELEGAIKGDTVLVCVMLANNETGVIQPLREISEIVHAKGCLLMSDATQAVGKIPVDVNALGIDLMAMSAHKFHGPKGVGALYVRRRGPRVSLAAQVHGGGHERGLRSGTLNVPGIVGMGKAGQLIMDNGQWTMQDGGLTMDGGRWTMRELRDKLEAALISLPGVVRNGHATLRLPNTSNLSFAGVEADALIQAMSGIAIATGSACTSALMQPSHVLSAMGVLDDAAFASIRFSLSRFTTEAEVDFAIGEVNRGLERLRGNNPPNYSLAL
jgi:cysteine desulfurase